jgi:restriction endonuclease BglII
MRLRPRLRNFSFRFAEQVLNSKLALKREIEEVLSEEIPDTGALSRPGFNKLLDEKFVARGWQRQPAVFDERGDPGAKLDFLKERLGVEVGFGHASFLGMDLLKFQVASYSALDKIDVGVYVVTTGNFQR